MPSALCHIAVEIFWGDKSAIYRTKITFPLYCKSPQLSVSPVKCAKVICYPALGYFLYDYKIYLNLTPSLGHFLSLSIRYQSAGKSYKYKSTCKNTVSQMRLEVAYSDRVMGSRLFIKVPLQ